MELSFIDSSHMARISDVYSRLFVGNRHSYVCGRKSLFSKKGASLIVFTMFIATVTCNLGENFRIDGGFTISYILFASVFILWGAGKFSLDNLFFGKTANNLTLSRVEAKVLYRSC